MGKILVIGATGTVGRLLVPRLLIRGSKVRALVYRESNAEALLNQGVEVFIGDFIDEVLDQAVAGVDKIFCLTPHVRFLILTRTFQNSSSVAPLSTLFC